MEAPEQLYQMTVSPEKAPDTAAVLEIEFRKGLPVRVTNRGDGSRVDGSLDLFLYLNKIG